MGVRRQKWKRRLAETWVYPICRVMPKVSDDRGRPGFETVFGKKPSVRKEKEDRCRVGESGWWGDDGGSGGI